MRRVVALIFVATLTLFAARFTSSISSPLEGPGLSTPDPAQAGASGVIFCWSRPRLTDRVTKGGFAVWYDPSATGAKAKAETVAAELNGKIRGTFGFMKPAVSDAGACDDGGTPGQLDFYLVPDLKEYPWSDRSDGLAYPLKLKAPDGTLSGFAEVNAGASGLNLLCTAAHEYFHLLQFRYGWQNPGRNAWWNEGTATLAEFIYDERCQAPHTFAGNFLHYSARKNITELNNPWHKRYESWVWPLFVQKTLNSRFVRSVFEGMGTGKDAAEAVDDQVWRKSFPDFVLRGFNKGKVDEFTKWKASPVPAEVDSLDASLNGLPSRDRSASITVEPGGGLLLMVSALDVDTRRLSIDVSDFTRQAGSGAHVRALLQPTKGPDPAAAKDEWDDATVANWDGVKKKSLCRDDGKDDDVQQVVLAFSNTNWDGKPLKATIKVHSEAMCAWSVAGNFDQSGHPPAGTADNSATGTFSRRLRFKLDPVKKPILCKEAEAPCLPLVGGHTHSVSWSIDVVVNDTEVLSTSTGHAGGSGARAVKNVENPAAGQAPPAALFQHMEWDATLNRFRPVFSITFVDSAAKQLGGQDTLRVPATTAGLSWHTVGDDWCGEGIDFVHDIVNTHGFVRDSEYGCPDESTTYGQNGPLVFRGLLLSEFTKADPSNPRGYGLCTIGFSLPYDFLSSGPCMQLSPDPYPSEVVTSLGFSGRKVEPDPIEPPDGYPQVDSCSQTGLSCEILAHAMGFEDWPMVLSVNIALKRAPDTE